MSSGDHIPISVRFGRFQISAPRRELIVDGQAVEIGGRAFDVLVALIEAQGAVVSKIDLMERAWPDRVVEENNLQIQISALRAAFGPDRNLIRTVAGRGYQFTGDIRVVSVNSTSAATPADRQDVLPPTNVPERISELIGRDDELSEILRMVQAQRLVTLTGAGGIGKTRLALEAGSHLREQFPDGVWVSELAALSDSNLVPAAVAAAAGLNLAVGEASAENVARALGQKSLLLLLDNCEQVIDGAALLAEAVLHANPFARILTTSREPLKADGEWTYRVPPLAVPPPDARDQDALLRYGAVQLFIARAQAVGPQSVLDRDLLAEIGAICRRLDGMPLAIELAAARTATLGVDDIAEHLDDRFRLLAGGLRTAERRQQTLHATLEWSYELLTAQERLVLRRLSVFAGLFKLQAAVAVVASSELAEFEVVDLLSNLVSKSLIERQASCYRLLETTRAFAFEQLNQSDEQESILRRHAEYHLALLEQAEVEWSSRATTQWLADYSPKIDNVRAALDWSFSATGDQLLGIALTSATIPLWMQLSLLQECRSRVEQALSKLRILKAEDPAREMKLLSALAASTLYSKGRVQELGAACKRALELARDLGDCDYQLRSLRGMFTFNSHQDFLTVLDVAERFLARAEGSPDRNDPLIGDGLIGLAQHYIGDQSKARLHTERMLAGFKPSNRPYYYAIRFQFDQSVVGRMTLARILWQQGYADQATEMVHSAVGDALKTNHAISACNALTRMACPIALWTGDLARAEHYIVTLVDLAKRYTLPLWCELGRMYEGVLAIKRGDTSAGLDLLRTGFEELGDGMPGFDHLKFESELAEGLGLAGQVTEGLMVAERAIDRCERTGERWILPELLRLKGELLLLDNGSATARAEDDFRASLDWARRQEVVAWELRAATSLCRLLRDQGRLKEAIALIQPVYDQFEEGFDTADLLKANALIAELQ